LQKQSRDILVILSCIVLMFLGPIGMLFAVQDAVSGRNSIVPFIMMAIGLAAGLAFLRFVEAFVP